MEYRVIQLDEYTIVISDDSVTLNSWAYCKTSNEIYRAIEPLSHYRVKGVWFKVIATIGKNLTGLKMLEIPDGVNPKSVTLDENLNLISYEK